MSSNLKADGVHISRTQFYKILKNEIYCGVIRKFGESHPGKFVPIVSKEQFNQVQRVLKFRSNAPKFYQIENPDFPLRRFVFHPLGFKLTGSWSKGKTKRYAYYHFWKVKGCFFAKESLETEFKMFMNEYRISGKYINRLIEFTKKYFLEKYETYKSERINSNKRIETLKNEQDAYAKKSISGIISDEIVKRRIDELDNEIRIITEKLYDKPVLPSKMDELIKFLHLYLECPGEVWDMASTNNKIQLQWFQFPNGVHFSNEGFGTQEICSLFLLKNLISDSSVPYSGPSVSHLEPTENAENSQKWLNVPLLENPAFWAKVLEDTQKLYDIVHGTNSVPKDIVELMDSLDESG